MRFGPKCEPGFLPVFSVADEAEARGLLLRACDTNIRGEYVARELVHEQSLPNLYAFGDRLREIHDTRMVPAGHCRCARNAAQRAAAAATTTTTKRAPARARRSKR